MCSPLGPPPATAPEHYGARHVSYREPAATVSTGEREAPPQQSWAGTVGVVVDGRATDD